MKLHLGHLLGVSAIIVAGCAAFFSVYGLSQLFAGASIAVIVMASALELSKLVAASFLHTYWSKMSKLLKIYLTVGVIVLVTITSAGIYGFLSNAYQKTAFNLEMHEGEIAVLDGKINQFKSKINTNSENIDSKTHRVTQLTDLRAKQEVRLDSMINRRYFSNANATRDEITKANEEISKLNTEVDELSKINNAYNDSISKYEIQKLEMKSSSDVAAEVGPLKYMAELINKPMDVVVNYFILLLILVFDPLAISLVVATNWIFENKKKEKGESDDEPEPTDPEPEKNNDTSSEPLKQDEGYGDPNDYEWPSITPVTPESQKYFSENLGLVEPMEMDSGFSTKEPTIEEEIPEDTTEDEIVDDIRVEEEKPAPRKPLTVDDINEIKKMKSNKVEEEPKEATESVKPRPEPKQSSSNNISRIGSNKYLKNGKDMIYRRNGNR